MEKFEFVSYKDTPDDKYGLGIATIVVNVPTIVTYKMIAKKDGGAFFVPATHNTTEGAEKKYIQGSIPNARADEQILMDFLRDNVNSLKNKQYARSVNTSTPGTYQQPLMPLTYPNEKKVEDEALPF